MKAAQCRERLIELLLAHITSIAEANAYLLGFRNAIADDNLDALQQALRHPEAAFESIERLERQRHHLLGESGFSRDRAGFEECVRWCDDEHRRVSNLYRQLVDALVELQHSIQVNSLLVNKGKDRVRRTIGILTGHGESDDGNTYSRKGKTSEGASRRNIAIA